MKLENIPERPAVRRGRPGGRPPSAAPSVTC